MKLKDIMGRLSGLEGRLLDDELYRFVGYEIEYGEYDQAAWARAVEDSHGNDAKIRADYVRHRVRRLKDELSLLRQQENPNSGFDKPAITPKPIDEGNRELLPAQKADLNDYPNAYTAIEYRREVADAWGEVKTMPKLYQDRFLFALDKEPNIDVESLKNLIRDMLNPYDDDIANKALAKARDVSEEAAEEFRRVYEMFGDKTGPDEILKKIILRYQWKSTIKPGHYYSKEIGSIEIASNLSVRVYNDTIHGGFENYSSFQDFDEKYWGKYDPKKVRAGKSDWS